MEAIETTMGKGLIVGAAGSGRVVAAVTVIRAEKRYCPHRIFERCEKHGIWHVFPGACPQCQAEKASDDAGQ